MEATLIQLSSFPSTRASRGLVKSFTLTRPFGPDHVVSPPADYRLLERMVESDEVISAAFDTTVDMVTRNGFDLVPKPGKTVSEETIQEHVQRLNDLNFCEVMDNIILSLLIYGDAFMELRRTTGKEVDELHILETTEMAIKHDEHGKIIGYVQRPFMHGSGGNGMSVQRREGENSIPFLPEEVIHFTLRKLGSQVYGRTPLTPIARVWSTRMHSTSYLLDAFKNLPPEMILHLRGATEEKAENFQASIHRKQGVGGEVMLTYGDSDSAIQVESIGFDPGKALMPVIEYLREAVLMITRVPPVWIGLVNKDGANRANSEAQVFSFETYTRKIQERTGNKSTRELLVALEMKDVNFSWNPVTSKSELEILKGAAVLKDLNVEPAVLARYLHRNGITDAREDDFIKVEDMPLPGGEEFNQTGANQTSPSRQAKGDRQEGMNTNLDRDGSSAAGKAKTKEKDAKQR